MRFAIITRVDGTTVRGRIRGAGNGSDQGLDLYIGEGRWINTTDIRSMVFDPDPCTACSRHLSDEDVRNGQALREGGGYIHADCAQERDQDAREAAHEEVLAAGELLSNYWDR